MSETLPEPISLWDFCDGLDDLHTDGPPVPFDPDELLSQLQNQNENHEDLVLPSLGVERGVEASPASELQDDKDIMAELSTYRDSTRSTSSDSEVLTVSPVVLPMPESHSLPIFANNTDISSATIIGGAVQRVSLQGDQSFEGAAGLIAQLPPMFRTKLDCPLKGGCAINTVKSLPGGSSCKGRDAIGSKHKFSCICGLKWQENNWREREPPPRKKSLNRIATSHLGVTRFEHLVPNINRPTDYAAYDSWLSSGRHVAFAPQEWG